MSEPGEPGEPGEDAQAAPDDLEHVARYYRGTITRVYYGSETGTIRSEASGREYRFRWPHRRDPRPHSARRAASARG